MARVDSFAHLELAGEDPVGEDPVVEDGVAIDRLSRRLESVVAVCDGRADRGGFLLGWLEAACGSAPSSIDEGKACGPLS